MALSDVQKNKIVQFIPTFKEYLNSANREDDLSSRKQRISAFEQPLSPTGIDQMTELEFGSVISMLWASQIWGNKGYLVDHLVNDNGMSLIKSSLKELLWSNQPLAKRYDAFRSNIKGMGPGMITEILTFTHPQECGLWNDKARKALILLGFEKSLPIVKKYQISGAEYEKFNTTMLEIRDELTSRGIEGLDLLGVDYFLYEVWKAGGEPPPEPEPITGGMNDFDHGEMIDKLIEIGQWLGFEVHKEKPIAAGSKVDAVWQAKIANLGVVTYVFEVQRKGSYDSLILNLQRAKSNPSVQRLIIVALPADIERLKKEINTLSEDFRKAVAYWEVPDLIRSSDLVTELAEKLGKLELVKAEFSV